MAKLNEPKKPVLVYGLIGLLVVISVGNYFVGKFNNYQIDKKQSVILNSAQKLFDSSDYAGAKIELQKALALDKEDNEVKALLKKVSNIEVSNKFLVDGQNFIADGKFFDAGLILSKVTNDDSELKLKADKLKNEIRNQIFEEVESKNQKSIKNKDFASAISLLNQLVFIFGQDQEVKNKIEEIQLIKSEESKKALKSLNSNYDQFNNVTWYKSSSSPQYRNKNAFYIYFGISDSNQKLPLRLVVQYESSDWLFIESATVNIDGSNYSINGNWERDNDSRIWEWIDEPFSDIELLNKIISSDSAVIRFDGQQYFDTREISGSQKRALREVLNAYSGGL